MSRKQSILIAGCGDIGSQLAELFYKDTRSKNITGPDNFQTYGLKRSKGIDTNCIRWIQADLTRPQTLTSIPEADYLIYTATPGQRTEAAYRRTYLEGLKHIVNAVEKTRIKRIFMVSSTSVYGQNNGIWVNEQTPAVPQSFSGRIIREAESWLENHSIPSSIIRFSGIYGPGRDFLIRKILAGGYSLQQSPPKYSNRIHRDDCALVLAHLIRRDNLNKPLASTYLASDCEPASEWEVHQWLGRRLGAEIPTAATHQRTTHQRTVKQNKRCSNSRLLQSGFVFKYPNFRIGYQAMIQSVHMKHHSD